MKRILVVISILLLASLACQMTGLPARTQPTPASGPQVSPPSLPDPASIDEHQDLLVSIYEQVLPGVVAIRTDVSLGSGFVFDDQGHVLTNQHVVDGSSTVEVDFTSGYKAQGTVIGSDADADVAVIKVDAPADQIHPLATGDSSKLQVGQAVVAI